MANPTLVSIGSGLTRFGFNAHLPIKGLVKSTVFKQFCGGETEQACLPLINRMAEKGIYSILDYSVEGKESEADFNAAMKKKLEL
ncbi:MAG: proline dehydrogenase, partial [Flavobacteriaceae bacterium]|nr:proline dehydrogenase [Flavobacteriaceae bacterium]